MLRLLKTIIFLLAILLVFSCSDTGDEKLDVDDSYIIEFGTQCGWCAGTKTISIKKGEIEYTRIIPCGNDAGTYTETRDFEYEKWDEQIAGFDTELFSSLEYNVCNVCVDGCDEIITIIHNNETHQIRYNPDTNIKSILPLQKKLRELFQEYFAEN